MNITPTVGRVVLFFCDNGPDVVPFPAMICAVSPDKKRVIVGGFTDEGIPFSCINVPLLSEGEVIPDDSPYAIWPPQKPQLPAIGL